MSTKKSLVDRLRGGHTEIGTHVGWIKLAKEAANELERLQRIIDGRPAINAALPESYIKWSQEIYLLDFVQATGAHS